MKGDVTLTKGFVTTDGLCCLADHANTKAPWTCGCPCHDAITVIVTAEDQQYDLGAIANYLYCGYKITRDEREEEEEQ